MSFLSRLEKKAIVAKPGYSRWLAPPAAIGIHMCIGTAYSWSIYNPALVKEFGVVASSSADWSLGSVVWVFSTAIAFLGISSAIAGTWLEKVGPRMCGTVAACLWGGANVLAAFAVSTHNIYLLYASYGVMGGCGLGLGYVTPVSTLIRWFPDRRGMATGFAIMGFGGGAMVGAPIKNALLNFYFQAPQYLGKLADVSLVTEGGKRFAQIGGALKEVVVLSAAEAAKLSGGLADGVYLAGTGSTGAAQTFLTMGIGFFVIMIIAAWSFRVPPEGFAPAGWDPSKVHNKKAAVTDKHVHIDTALKTPQFYCQWVVLCTNVTAGIGIVAVAKTLMSEIFGSALPLIVTGAFASAYVGAVSVANMTGRLFWASASDYLGRKVTFGIFFALGCVLYFSVPFAAQQVAISPAVTWLVMFYAGTMIIFTMYGGGFATIPAYIADVFGTRYVGGIHGRLLTAWSTAGVAGPLLLTSLRESSVNSALHDLATKVDPAKFQAVFGTEVAKLDQLIAAKAVTIPKLMELVPAGTVDPTPSLYNTTMYVMAALLIVGFVANLLIRPVNPKYHMTEAQLANSGPVEEDFH